MESTIITAVQLYAIGITLGVGTQCFFICAPLLLPYVAAVDNNWKQAVRDLALLVGGRLLAYVLLGAVAGVSGGYVEKLAASGAAGAVRAISGALIIACGLAISLGLSFKVDACGYLSRSAFSKGGLLLIGFAIGLAPCLPLISVMFEIALISHSVFAGAAYALCFGAGTAVATVVTVGPLATVLGHLPSRILASRLRQTLFRMACGALLIVFGALFLLSGTL